MRSTVSVEVCEGWAVYFGSRHRTGGEQIEVPLDQAREWRDAGWVKVLPPPPEEVSGPRA